jgi:hypothetical protein
VWKGGEQVMSRRDGEVLSMGRLVEQLFRQKCVEEQLIMWSSGEQLLRQRRVKKQLIMWSSEEQLFKQIRVKKTANNVELWRMI